MYSPVLLGLDRWDMFPNSWVTVLQLQLANRTGTADTTYRLPVKENGHDVIVSMANWQQHMLAINILGVKLLAVACSGQCVLYRENGLLFTIAGKRRAVFVDHFSPSLLQVCIMVFEFTYESQRLHCVGVLSRPVFSTCTVLFISMSWNSVGLTFPRPVRHRMGLPHDSRWWHACQSGHCYTNAVTEVHVSYKAVLKDFLIPYMSVCYATTPPCTTARPSKLKRTWQPSCLTRYEQPLAPQVMNCTGRRKEGFRLSTLKTDE